MKKLMPIFLVLLPLTLMAQTESKTTIRVGLIGCDTHGMADVEALLKLAEENDAAEMAMKSGTGQPVQIVKPFPKISIK